jgi:putative oxidoreductase
VKWLFKNRLDSGLFVLRIGIGLMFVFVHGLPKLAGGIALWKGLGGAFNRLIGISFLPEFWGFAAAVAEFGGGLFLITGILFRPACALMFFTMAIAAASVIRGGYGFNGASQAIELGIVLLALFLAGPGRFTVSTLFKTKPENQP